MHPPPKVRVFAYEDELNEKVQPYPIPDWVWVLLGLLAVAGFFAWAEWVYGGPFGALGALWRLLSRTDYGDPPGP
jgi:hypothetical protein